MSLQLVTLTISAPPLWWAFTSDYSGVSWARRGGIVLATWAIPIVTLVLAITNRCTRRSGPASR